MLAGKRLLAGQRLDWNHRGAEETGFGESVGRHTTPAGDALVGNQVQRGDGVDFCVGGRAASKVGRKWGVIIWAQLDVSVGEG